MYSSGRKHTMPLQLFVRPFTSIIYMERCVKKNSTQWLIMILFDSVTYEELQCLQLYCCISTDPDNKVALPSDPMAVPKISSLMQNILSIRQNTIYTRMFKHNTYFVNFNIVIYLFLISLKIMNTWHCLWATEFPYTKRAKRRGDWWFLDCEQLERQLRTEDTCIRSLTSVTSISSEWVVLVQCRDYAILSPDEGSDSDRDWVLECPWL